MTLVLAHRGYCTDAAENTIAAFHAAAMIGADWVELDVRRTIDDVLVAHHDAHLADGRPIIELAADDLPDDVPTLAEVFESCPDVGINVEIKNSPGDPDYDEQNLVAVAVAGLVAAYRSPDDVLVTSFNPNAVEQLQATDPAIPVGVVAFEALDPMQLVDRAAARGHTAILPYLTLTTGRLVERAHEENLTVNVWTVNEPDAMRRVVDLGVDGIITDRPDVARGIVDRN